MNSCTTRERALGAYVLPGGVTDSSLAIGQAHAAERIGLSTLWISERLGSRDLGVVAGAIGQATTTLRIGSAVTPFQIRHPVVLASLASTLQSLTRGRFLLGLGRGGSWLAGLGVVPTAPAELVIDMASLLRRLWAGQTGDISRARRALPRHATRSAAAGCTAATAHGGPGAPLAATGRAALRWRDPSGLPHPPRGGADDGRGSRAAAAARRDPGDVRVYATVITITSPTADDLGILAGRAVTYLQPPVHGERLLHLNGWDLAPLTRLRAHPLIAGLGGALADQAYSPKTSRRSASSYLSTGSPARPRPAARASAPGASTNTWTLERMNSSSTAPRPIASGPP